MTTQDSILQKHDTAAAAVVQDQTKLNRMKTRYLKMNWLIPVLGIAVVAGSIVAGTTYLNLERKTQAAEALTATLDRLYQDQMLSAALKTLHAGEAAVAAQRLDLLLCDDILRTNSELASADARTRTFVEDAFRRIALLRPKIAHGAAAGSAQDCTGDQAAAQRILELALAGDHSTQTK
jgi:hypothetical protein